MNSKKMFIIKDKNLYKIKSQSKNQNQNQNKKEKDNDNDNEKFLSEDMSKYDNTIKKIIGEKDDNDNDNDNYYDKDSNKKDYLSDDFKDSYLKFIEKSIKKLDNNDNEK